MNTEDKQSQPTTPENQPEHEFSEEHNEIFDALFWKTRFIAKCALVMGLIGICKAAFDFLASDVWSGVIDLIAIGGLYGLMSIWYFKASSSFKMIVDTTGGDITHLMQAMQNLKRIYTLMYYAILGALLALLPLTIIFILHK